MSQKFWQTKLKARLHEPFTKPLTKILHLDDANDEAIGHADKWTLAADRPQWLDADWSKLEWSQAPRLIHPLSGDELDLKSNNLGLDISGSDTQSITDAVVKHVTQLSEEVNHDAKKSHLALWRFSSDLFNNQDDNERKLAALWRMTPSDGRVPDHSVADHSDLASAFAGAFSADENKDAALLALAIGPVQPFIAAARSTSDLWAGSHLLSRLSWEAMKPVVQALGPDAILFPRLRGVPQVDLWLRNECELPAEWFKECAWMQDSSDSNPLFSAALPNRFVAVVPTDQAESLAAECEKHVREWLQEKGKEVVDRLLKEVGETQDESLYCYHQMREQLDGFPEVHWSAVPFSLIGVEDKERQTELKTGALLESMAPLYGAKKGDECGFLKSEAWRVLRQEIKWKNGNTFFVPTPGVLYPAVFDLAERVLASAKSLRQFEQLEQKGWRCSLSGEGEWLTTDKEQLTKSYRQQENTLWAKVARKRPSWAKKGEHLSALPALKRLWPTLFAEEVGEVLKKKSIQRFVVSTHTMALAYQLSQWLALGGSLSESVKKRCDQWQAKLKDLGGVALPKRLVEQHRLLGREKLQEAKQLVGLLELAAELEDERERDSICKEVQSCLNETLKTSRPVETYYGLMLMDGDHMGRILSGDDIHSIAYKDSFHPSVREGFENQAESEGALKNYSDQKRAVSPSRHMAISGALNDFSQQIVRHVVEEEYLGKLIYAGGDDVLAMLPVADLLPAAQRLRQAYSGVAEGEQKKELRLQSGFAQLKKVLYRTMGSSATASAGLVIAHHRAPLWKVMTELRAAESVAKNAGRDRFHLRVIKRSGGVLHLTLPWGALKKTSDKVYPAELLLQLCDYLRDVDVSRRMVFQSLGWMKDLPEPEGNAEMLVTLLAYQLKRQAGDRKITSDYLDLDGLARRLARLAASHNEQHRDSVNGTEGSEKTLTGLAYLANFMSVAEFLAREGRGEEEQT